MPRRLRFRLPKDASCDEPRCGRLSIQGSTQM
jgi:hypothetical protein